MRKPLLLLSALLVLFSCGKADKSETASGSDENVVREYFANGKLKTEISVRDSFRQGPTKNYDAEGHLLSEVNYVDNVKEGITTNYYVPSGNVNSTLVYKAGIKEGDEIWYYESGKEYRVTPYVGGKMNGVQKLYYESGELMAEVPYRDNYPGKGLKEYREDGTLRDDYPTIVITKEDHLATANSVLLRITMSNNSPNVKFYRGTLEDGIYMSDELSEMATQNGVTQLQFNLPRGARLNQDVHIVARYESRASMPYVTDRTYNLQIFNTF